jgi:hypothetical protein
MQSTRAHGAKPTFPRVNAGQTARIACTSPYYMAHPTKNVTPSQFIVTRSVSEELGLEGDGACSLAHASGFHVTFFPNRPY